jgi:hypothetical protein
MYYDILLFEAVDRPHMVIGVLLKLGTEESKTQPAPLAYERSCWSSPAAHGQLLTRVEEVVRVKSPLDTELKFQLDCR